MQLLNRLTALVTLPEDDENTRLKKRILLIASSITLPFLLLVGITYLAFGETIAGWSYAVFALYGMASLALFITRHHNAAYFYWSMAIPVVPIHLVVSLSLGSFVNSGGVVLWGLAFPVVTGMVFVPFRQTIPGFILFIFNIIVSILAQPYVKQSVALPQTLVYIIFISNITVLSTFIVMIFAYFIRQRDEAYQLLHIEQAKSESLLLNILPEEIATILKNEQRTIADDFENVSILFADVVGFTPLSASMTPIELVEMLNDIFSYFDMLVDKYDLEKIKTIGDCYMVASGVPRHRPDHATALTRMALEMQEYVAKNDFRGKKVNFRIGINSGAVVAGVIGRKKFIYDLWGDAVNTASRMESHSSGGAIQITESTYQLIAHDFQCESRGIINIKGKGDMAVWFVVGEK
jgi:adenylate cyclase